MEAELNLLLKQDIIEPVSASDWGSPLVVIPKLNGDIRLCVDYKIGVNQQLITASFPIPKISDIVTNL